VAPLLRPGGRGPPFGNPRCGKREPRGERGGEGKKRLLSRHGVWRREGKKKRGKRVLGRPGGHDAEKGRWLKKKERKKTGPPRRKQERKEGRAFLLNFGNSCQDKMGKGGGKENSRHPEVQPLIHALQKKGTTEAKKRGKKEKKRKKALRLATCLSHFVGQLKGGKGALSQF